MLEHIVLIKFKEETPAGHAELVKDALLSLKEEITVIKRITAGINFSDRGQGFSLGLVVTFDNEAALKEYDPHPAHQKVIEDLIAPYKADVIACDYLF